MGGNVEFYVDDGLVGSQEIPLSSPQILLEAAVRTIGDSIEAAFDDFWSNQPGAEQPPWSASPSAEASKYRVATVSRSAGIGSLAAILVPIGLIVAPEDYDGRTETQEQGTWSEMHTLRLYTTYQDFGYLFPMKSNPIRRVRQPRRHGF